MAMRAVIDPAIRRVYSSLLPDQQRIFLHATSQSPSCSALRVDTLGRQINGDRLFPGKEQCRETTSIRSSSR
jgi:hypothetical protein